MVYPQEHRITVFLTLEFLHASARPFPVSVIYCTYPNTSSGTRSSVAVAFCLKFCLSLGSDQTELLAIGRWSQEKSKQNSVPPRESRGVTVGLFQAKAADQNQKEESGEGTAVAWGQLPCLPRLKAGERPPTTRHAPIPRPEGRKKGPVSLS